jgi:hypothetical protein
LLVLFFVFIYICMQYGCCSNISHRGAKFFKKTNAVQRPNEQPVSNKNS